MKNIKAELEVVKQTSTPNTTASLIKDFKMLGVQEGSVILMHSSLSKIGWTIGGPIAVIDAILEILTQEGTLVMPSFTNYNTDPSEWQKPPVPQEWWDIIRKCMPGFHSELSPTRSMGVIAETFRKYPGVVRSNHPVASFAAWGKYALKIVSNHNLHSDLGEHSPLARIYELDGKIMLLGVGHSNNSSLHLAEYRSEYHGKQYKSVGSAIIENHKRVWKEWLEIDHYSEDFRQIGKEFEDIINYKPKKVGIGEARLLSQKDIVDFAIRWMFKNREI
jgi:aminoglycoside 3-N-acetyltransferase